MTSQPGVVTSSGRTAGGGRIIGRQVIGRPSGPRRGPTKATNAAAGGAACIPALQGGIAGRAAGGASTAKGAAMLSRVVLAIALISYPTQSCLAAATGRTQTRQAPVQTDRGKGRRVQFQPGVWIDWSVPQVEIAGQVVLRRGPLELLACSPHTREHESIVRLNARPLHVFQALGLIGLEPGHPPYYDIAADRPVPAAGAPMEVWIRWEDKGHFVAVPAEQWLLDRRTGKPPGRLPWVFAGSAFDGAGRFQADAEGTVITLVDFPSALVALAASHSESNALLWCEANSGKIPPVGTAVTVILRGATTSLSVRIDAWGLIEVAGRSTPLADLLERLRQAAAVGRALAVRIEYDPRFGEAAAEQVAEALRFAGARSVHLAETAGPNGRPAPLTALLERRLDLQRTLRALQVTVEENLTLLNRTAGGLKDVLTAVAAKAKRLKQPTGR